MSKNSQFLAFSHPPVPSGYGYEKPEWVVIGHNRPAEFEYGNENFVGRSPSRVGPKNSYFGVFLRKTAKTSLTKSQIWGTPSTQISKVMTFLNSAGLNYMEMTPTSAKKPHFEKWGAEPPRETPPRPSYGVSRLPPALKMFLSRSLTIIPNFTLLSLIAVYLEKTAVCHWTIGKFLSLIFYLALKFELGTYWVVIFWNKKIREFF